MSGPVELTAEQIAADFCSANPGKNVLVIKDGHGIKRDSAGVVTEVETPIPDKDPEEGVNEAWRETCPSCYTKLVAMPRGGVECPRPGCGYWFCF